MFRKLRVFVVIGVFALSGCQGYSRPAINVSTDSPRNDVFYGGYATVGVVEPQTQVDVIPKYGGTVEQTFKEVGDRVAQGETLLQLDTTPVMNQIKTAQAGLAQATAGVTQANTSVEQAMTGIDKANKGVEQANVGLESAKIGLTTTESGSVAQTLLQYQTALDTAQTAYDAAILAQEQAQSTYDDTKILYDAGVTARAGLDTAASALDRANAAVDTARTTLDAAQKNLDLYDSVMSGQSVASAQSNVKTAEVGVESAYSTVESANASLHSAQAAVAASRAAVNTSQTQLEILQSQLDDYTVVSPIDGIIVSKKAVAGATVGQSTVYSVANIDSIIITTTVPKDEINKLSLGGEAQVFYDDNSSVQTRITAISNTANAANLYMVQVTVDNKDHNFKPGMNVDTVFVENQVNSVIVPFSAVVSSNKDNYIFIAENDTARKVYVNVLGKHSAEISIEPIGQELSRNTRVITSNADILKDGDLIIPDN